MGARSTPLQTRTNILIEVGRCRKRWLVPSGVQKLATAFEFEQRASSLLSDSPGDCLMLHLQQLMCVNRIKFSTRMVQRECVTPKEFNSGTHGALMAKLKLPLHVGRCFRHFMCIVLLDIRVQLLPVTCVPSIGQEPRRPVGPSGLHSLQSVCACLQVAGHATEHRAGYLVLRAFTAPSHLLVSRSRLHNG
jgi:hypothetical protein